MKLTRNLMGLLALGLLMGQSDRFAGSRAGEGREIAAVKFRWAPAGRFVMGSPVNEAERRADEGPVEVTISHGFWVGQYEVTQGEWVKRMKTFPQAQDRGVGDDFPVHWVSFVEAEEYCRRFTVEARGLGELPEGWEIRLPTEAQWEYACRAGTKTATAFGERMTRTETNIGSDYPGGGDGDRNGRASKVGSYGANAWGIFDMHGNEWEWCRDWYHRVLPGGVDPDLSRVQGERNRDGTYSRVRRGGAWVEPGWANRSGMRLRYEPERRSDHIGFRVVAVRR